MKNTFKIIVGETPATTYIELNGQPLQGVRRFSVEVDATKRELSFLSLEIYGEALIEGEYVERLISASARPPASEALNAMAKAWLDRNDAGDGTPV